MVVIRKEQLLQYCEVMVVVVKNLQENFCGEIVVLVMKNGCIKVAVAMEK